MPPRAADPPDAFAYTAFYCEENVWHLAQHPALRALPRRVVFVSNAARVCPLWCQRAAPAPDEPVFWDYHVVLVARDAAAGWQVWDLDSLLGMPVPLADYLARTFRPPAGRAGDGAAIPRELAPRFRVLDADEFVGAFSSDRAHMRGADGAYTRPPPPWPAIGAGRAPNLARFVDTRESPPFLGRVCDLAGLRAHFAE